jgi:hypothetical protein
MLRNVRLCKGATSSTSVTIRGKAAKVAPTIARCAHNDDLLLWSSVSYGPEIVSTLSRPPCVAGGIWVKSGIGFMRLATIQRNAANQQQRSLQEKSDQQSLSFALNLQFRLSLNESPVYSAQKNNALDDQG